MENLNEEQLLQNRDALATHYQAILGLLGEDTEREGLLKTPMRVAKAMQYLTKGYREDPAAVLRSAMFEEEDYKQMVIVKDIDFFSLCEHHMLPFFGKAHVAYIPRKYITGLSKIPRVVDRLHPADVKSVGRNGGYRGPAHVYADAWRGKAELSYHNF